MTQNYHHPEDKPSEKQSDGETLTVSKVVKTAFRPPLRLALTGWKLLMNIDFLAAREWERCKREFPHVRTCEETIDRILAGASIARYGDGEFGVALGRSCSWPASPRLQERLREILQVKPDEKFLLAIPPVLQLFDTAPKTNIPLLKRWRRFVQKNINRNRDIDESVRRWNFHDWFWIRHWRFIKRLLPEPIYDNAFVSRLELFQTVPLEKIKRIWENRHVVFVVPKRGRYVYEERLFGTVKSADHIFIDACDAFADYDAVLSESLTKPKESLFLIAAGPTATVLAYDLHRAGYQALDIGHLPNCYQQFLGEQPAPEKLKVLHDGVFLDGVRQERDES